MRNKQIEREIELEALGLDVGESIGDLVCPFCGGGRNSERKFSISRIDTGLLYNCYRASCSDGRGFVATRGDLLHGTKPPIAKSKWKGPYWGEFRPIGDKDRAYFAERFDLGASDMDFVGVNESGYYVLEIKTMDGYVRGYVVRRGCWSGHPACPRRIAASGPKSAAYLNSPDDISISWHRRAGADSELVIVEDQISAAKVAQAGHIGAALTGSYLSEDKVIEIAKAKPTRVTIALDQDATGTAFSAARRWGLAFPAIRVLPLARDIKDMKHADVVELLK
jgi:hypothetical protein